MRRVQATFIGLALMSTTAAADMDFDHMQAAMGLGAIVVSAGECAYKVDEQALADYYVKAGLATPEGLAYINGTMSMKKFAEKPSASQCALIRATAKSFGLLTD